MHNMQGCEKNPAGKWGSYPIKIDAEEGNKWAGDNIE